MKLEEELNVDVNEVVRADGPKVKLELEDKLPVVRLDVEPEVAEVLVEVVVELFMIWTQIFAKAPTPSWKPA